jgi:dihydrofolate reductase
MIGNSQGRKPRISIIVAMAKNRVIGANNALPWHLSSDLKRFKALTMGHHIIMGRKTFESIGRILPGRTSVVVSRNPGYRPAGALVAADLDSALATAERDSEAFVIGGAEIYRAALPVADRILLTEIDRDFDGDAFFPAIESSVWKPISREPVSDTDLPASFVVLEKR